MPDKPDLYALFPGLPRLATTPALPWIAETHSPTPSGAVLIQDQHGNVIGWATDVAGHTTETTSPEGRSTGDIARNATLLAMAPTMAAIIRLIGAAAPCLLTTMDARGIEPPHGLRTSLRAAIAMLGKLGP